MRSGGAHRCAPAIRLDRINIRGVQQLKRSKKAPYEFRPDPPSEVSTNWREQFDRLGRWHSRLSSSNIQEIFESVHDPGYKWHSDLLLAFFQNCFHLKDWLIASKVVKQQEINQFFDANVELKIYRDFCNGSKHFHLDSPSLTGSPHYVRRVNMHAEPLELSPSMIEAEGHYYEIVELVNRCMSLWKTFLRERHLY